MKIRFFGLAAVATLSTGAYAQLNEAFNYANGNLTTVSAGAWQLWDPASSGDATVTSNVGVINDTTDVVRQFSSVLTTTGSSANFSLSFLVSTSNSAESYEMFFSPATTPFSTGQLYPQSFGLTFDAGTATAGQTTIAVDEGNATTTVQTQLAQTMSIGAFHTLSGTFTRGATNASYTLSLDGTQVRTGTFALTSNLGLNAFEFYNIGASAADSARIDNITVTAVPEPASLAVLGIGAITALRRRRRK